MRGLINIELFSCAGGMAEGFKRAGIEFDLVVDKDPNAISSYETNIGHRPVQMDVRDLIRLVRLGVAPRVRLLVADPPCTPYSSAGKGLGVADERDCMRETVELIKLLRPHCFLIGNVPGLDTAPHLKTVQETIGSLSAKEHGYCTRDYASLDAADFGVPQHRVRPFWFGHRGGPCIKWPKRTHGPPSKNGALLDELVPWVTCRQALGHLTPEEMGRPVKLRAKANPRARNQSLRMYALDEPRGTITTKSGRDGSVLYDPKHPPNALDQPSMTLGAKQRSQAEVLVLDGAPPTPPHDHEATSAALAAMHADGRLPDVKEIALLKNHPVSKMDEPARTVRCRDHNSGETAIELADEPEHEHYERHPLSKPDEPAFTVRCRDRVSGGTAIEWPWDRPATSVTTAKRLSKPGHHDPKVSGDQFANWMDERPSTTIMAGNSVTGGPGKGSICARPGAVVLTERAASILQGFPDGWKFHGKTKEERWQQIGQAMPPPLAHAVAVCIKSWLDIEAIVV